MKGKTVVITGGSRGLGAVLCGYFRAAGAAVHSLSRTVPEPDDMASCAWGAEFLGPEVRYWECDLRDTTSTYEAFRDIGHVDGRVDVLVNNAGCHRKCFDVNYAAARDCAMHARNCGATHIVNIGSVAGEYHSPRMISYSASKAALHSLTKSLARKYAPDVLVNCVAPGILNVGMGAKELEANPEVVELNLLKKAGTADEVCRAVHLCARAEFMTGQVIGINGGLVI
jgi:NAD(P)-dependent dehydrogenase (short-subunit alcohol dehydrogenase family)